MAAKGNGAGVTPDYWDDACKHLSRRDRVMKKLIPQFGEARLQSRGDAFATLARSIVGQQISVKAAQSVWTRWVALMPKFQPAAVLGLSVEEQRAAGLSARKVEYLADLAKHFDSGQVHGTGRARPAQGLRSGSGNQRRLISPRRVLRAGIECAAVLES